MKQSRGEARLKQALQDILDTATAADDSLKTPLDPFQEAKAAAVAAGIFSPTAANVSESTSKVRPFEQEDLWRRLRTFKSLTWFCKPPAAAPVECARRGWINTNRDLLTCEWCAAKVSFSPPSGLPHEELQKAAKKFASELASKHSDLCPWQNVACSPDLVAFPVQKASLVASEFMQRSGSFDVLDQLPPISQDVLAELAARGDQVEALLARVPLASAPDPTMDDGIGYSATRDPEPRRPAALPPQRAPTYSDSAAAVESAALSALSVTVAEADSIEFQRVKQLLALIGWSVVPIPGSTRHLEAPEVASLCTPQRSSGQRRRIRGSQAVLFCRICGAKHGLWSFLGENSMTASHAAALTTTPLPLRSSVRGRSVSAALSVPCLQIEADRTSGLSGLASPNNSLRRHGLSAKATIAGGSFHCNDSAPQGSRSGICSQSGDANRSGGSTSVNPAPFGSAATRLPAFCSGAPSPSPQGNTPRMDNQHDTNGAAAKPVEASVHTETTAAEMNRRKSPPRNAEARPFGHAAASSPAFGISAIRQNKSLMQPVTPQPPSVSVAGTKRCRSQDQSPKGPTANGKQPADGIKRFRLTTRNAAADPEDDSVKQPIKPLDPLQLHRPFCPWVAYYTAADGQERCGWVSTLNALSPAEPKANGSTDDTANKDAPRDRFAGLLALLRNGWTGHA